MTLFEQSRSVFSLSNNFTVILLGVLCLFVLKNGLKYSQVPANVNFQLKKKSQLKLFINSVNRLNTSSADFSNYNRVCLTNTSSLFFWNLDGSILACVGTLFV